MKRKRNLLWYVRMTLVGSIFFLGSLLLLPIAYLRFGNTGNNLLYVQALSYISRRVLGLTIRPRGREIVDASQPCVFIMNHQHTMDILLNTELYPKRCVLVAKRWVGLVPLFGWYIWASGTLLLNRADRSNTLAKLNAADVAIREKGLSVWLFPEGTRSRGRGLGALKKGAFYMAIKNQVPVVPVVASSYVGKMDFTKWRSGTVLISVLPPIPTKGMGVEAVPELLERARTIMHDAIAELDREIERMTGSLQQQPVA
jgi:1-acyl-sn-glycerol-3-phosphate acyltransferase